MENLKNNENEFSKETFDLLEEWHERNKPYASDTFSPDDNFKFRKFVQAPFVNFCNLIHKKIPIEIAGRNLNNVIPDKVYIQHFLDRHSYWGLEIHLGLYSILIIDITCKGIEVGFVGNIDEILSKAIVNKGNGFVEQLIINMLKDFIEHNEGHISYRLFWGKDKILENKKDLIDDFLGWFDKYFPLLLFALSEKEIPKLNNYSYRINQAYTLIQCAEETGLSGLQLERWLRSIERKGQAIFYGSPGTGKTFIAEKLAKHLIGGGNGFCELIQFHPAYTYEDFIQGIRPQSKDGQLTYSIVPGRFLEFCKKAESCDGICVLIIDEINRANLAQVFGELMYLLEYRDKEIPLAGGNTFSIPSNVRIIGTMNTADRSIALVDHALRRRFAFIEIRPNYDVLRNYHEKRNTGFKVDGLIQGLEKLNLAISDKNYELGISFFLTEKLAEDIEDIWKMEIEPYLEEYFFDRLEKVDEFRWNNIKNQVLP